MTRIQGKVTKIVTTELLSQPTEVIHTIEGQTLVYDVKISYSDEHYPIVVDLGDIVDLNATVTVHRKYLEATI